MKEGSKKRVREKLLKFEEISMIRIKLVERVGSKIVDLLHKSDPWDDIQCGRKECELCMGSEEKQWGKCRKRNLVYEHECMTCRKVIEEKRNPSDENRNDGEKEKNVNISEEVNMRKRKPEEGGEGTELGKEV